MRITINEQAAGRDEYIPTAYNLEDEIYCHCAYFLVYNMPQTANHWKKELYGFIKRIKKIKVSSGSKAEYTETALVTMAHGEHFCEDIEEATKVFSSIYHSEDKPHPFDYDMVLRHNQEIFFNALDQFYYKFLVPWIAIPDEDPPREPLYDAIDKYLIARRRELIPV